jgi:hypothetical protein
MMEMSCEDAGKEVFWSEQMLVSKLFAQRCPNLPPVSVGVTLKTMDTMDGYSSLFPWAVIGKVQLLQG